MQKPETTRADDAAPMCAWCETRVQGACKSHYDTMTCTHRVIAPTAEEWDSAIEARAAELHEGCRMPMEQAREIAASEASPDWYARGQDWGLADALTNGQSGDWVLDDIARAFAAGARAGAAVAQHTIKRMQSALEESASRSADYLRKAIKAEAEIARRDADAERERHAHTDWVDDDVRVRHPRA
jgi:hypothetical protein